MNVRRVTALTMLAAILGAGSLVAQVQATTGLVRGTVRDSTGNPIPNASVVLRHLETNLTRSHTTNAQGAYVASLLRVGSYEVVFRAVGYAPVRKTDVQVSLGATTALDATLAPSAVELQAITVVAESPLVEQARTASATRLDSAVVQGLPNNGRNFLNLTTLTPNVAIVQGPDGDEISIGGQRGIHNNVSVDGADFNNQFFGGQRGGQRQAFTFNLDAIEDMVVVAQGANAEFGRSGGGFINVITKSGTNEFHGTAHVFGKFDQLSNDYAHSFPDGSTSGFTPDYSQAQFGFTLGGPIKRDKAFFFLAYDQQLYTETKQANRLGLIDDRLLAWTDTAFGGALAGDFGSIERTDDARALMAKVDVRLNDRNSLALKYNYTWSKQVNGTFDVDIWGRSANGIEQDYSHALNGSLVSQLSSSSSNEFRFQVSREDRPRPYEGPTNPSTNRPFPDTDISFTGFRIGQPFFLPVEAYDTRIQLLDNISWHSGNHFFKAGVEYNRTNVKQTFIGFANGRIAFNSVQGFLNYVRFGNLYVECSNNSFSTTGSCPTGTSITGPVELYLQQAGVGGLSVEEAGTQEIPQNEIALFLQDSWKPTPNLTVDYGLRWEAQIQPDPITPASEVFYAPFIGQTVTNNTGTYRFPSDGNIPSDYSMWQPRLGFAWDRNGDGTEVLRANAGIYYARTPGLNLASSRSTNGSRGQTLFRNSALTGILGPPPVYGQLLPSPSGDPFQPGVFVFDEDFQNPRTISASFSYEREVAAGVSLGLTYTHASTDNLTRFIDRNAGAFGNPWSTGLPGGNGLGTLTVVEASAKSRYNGITLSMRRSSDPDLQFQFNYTLSWDKADDDNERDPFSFRYVDPTRLDREYNWSDRDQRHRFNGWLLWRAPGDIYLNNRVSIFSAQPISEKCGAGNTGTGERAAVASDRICPDGSILLRNTLRKDNALVNWDVRISKPFALGNGRSMEAIVEVFNLTNADNFRDPSSTGLFLNFDGTIRSGLSEPRQAQVGLRYVF